MLAVGVDAPAVGVAVLRRVLVPGGDRRGQTAVPAEGQDLRSTLPRDPLGPVGRAVVDDEEVRTGQVPTQLVEDGGKALFLVPGGDEDERVAPRIHALSVFLSRAGIHLSE